MTEFQITYGFNVRRFIRYVISAETSEQAAQIARDMAREKIGSECSALENSTGYGSNERLEAYMFVDVKDPRLDMDPVAEEPLPFLDADDKNA